MGTVLGVEEEPILRALRREGLDDELAEMLLSPCVAGMIAALNEKDDVDGKD